MNEFNHEAMEAYAQNLKESMLKQWERVNKSITSFELNLNRQRKMFEENHLKMLQEVHKETQKCISDFSSKSNDLREMIIGLREQLAYIATQQNLEEISKQSTALALKEAKTLINKDLWDENLQRLFDYINGITKAVGEFSQIVFTYDMRFKVDHPSLFKELNESASQFLNSTLQEAELSVRTENCLLQTECKTMRDVYKKPPSELLKHRNFGKKSINELRKKFEDKGIKW